MLVLAFGNCEKCGGGLGPMATEQSAGVSCKKCGYKFISCERCKSAGCPECRGALLNAWEHIKLETGQDIMF